MVDHVVLFRLKSGVSDQAIDKAVKALNDLQFSVPRLIAIRAGRNFSERGKSHRLMLIAQFESREDLEYYAVHPAHRKVVDEIIAPLRDEVLVGDIET